MKNSLRFLFACLILLLTACNMGQNYQPQEVVIFTKEGCPRCAEAKEILLGRQRQFKEKNIADPKYRQEMWDILHQKNGGEEVRLVMPVVIVDGEVYYNIPQLPQFFSGI